MEWIKNNWLLLVLLSGLALLAWRHFDSTSLYDKLMKDYNAQAKEHDREIQRLEKINQDRHEEQERLNDIFHKEIVDVNTRFDDTIEEIATEGDTQKKELIKEAKKNPIILTNSLNEVFGIPVYEEKKETK